MAIFTPNLALVKYVGEIPRKLWEARARKVPTLQKGDMVLLPEVTAILMCKKNGFILVDTQELSFAGENKEQKSIEEYLSAIGMSEADIEKFIEDNKQKEEENLDSVDEFIKMEDKMLSEKTSEDAEELVLPSKEKLEELDEETVKMLCNHLSITMGNKKLDTLKSILLPYLPE